jgi:MOSC domain-containing protein YiiM
MEIKALMQHYYQAGKVVSVSVRPERLKPVELLESVLAIENTGLQGDRAKGGNRQVTLIQKEHMLAVASFLGKPELDFMLTRRNILVEGINLLSLKGKQFQLGGALLEYSGECHPCSRMEEALGVGGYNAMRGHGGITARVVIGGQIKLEDTLSVKTN